MIDVVYLIFSSQYVKNFPLTSCQIDDDIRHCTKGCQILFIQLTIVAFADIFLMIALANREIIFLKSFSLDCIQLHSRIFLSHMSQTSLHDTLNPDHVDERRSVLGSFLRMIVDLIDFY